MDSDERRGIEDAFQAFGNTPQNRRDSLFNFDMNRELQHRESLRGIIRRDSVNLAFADFDEDDYEHVA
jgi:hypothetical protein